MWLWSTKTIITCQADGRADSAIFPSDSHLLQDHLPLPSVTIPSLCNCGLKMCSF